jgi:galactose mutarotase-like enzyme
MANVRTYQDGPYRMVELAEEKSGSWLRICPERGGIATSFGSEGEELFYLDRETFLDPTANIRGGNPILFPISGQLKEGRYELDGKEYRMKNHGLARTSPWEVEETGIGASGEAFARLRLTSTEEMLEAYPFAFELVFTYSLLNGAMEIRQEYRNRSERSMPMYPGFHPYFATPVKKLKYETDASLYYDYNDGLTKSFGGEFDIAPLQESIVLTDAKEPRISFLLPASGRRVMLEYSGQFRYVVLWSASGKDFVCVEPWMALTGEFHRGEELVWVPGGETLQAVLAIRSARE